MSFYKNKKEENYDNKFKATLWITLHCKLSVILLFVWIQYLPVEMKGKPLYSGILQTKGKIKLYSCEYVHICMNHKTQFCKQNRMESGDTNWGAPGNVLSMCSKVSETSFEFRNIALYFFFAGFIFICNMQKTPVNLLLAPSENKSTKSPNGRNLSKWTFCCKYRNWVAPNWFSKLMWTILP